MVPVGRATTEFVDDNYLKTISGLYPDLLKDLKDGKVIVYSHQWRLCGCGYYKMRFRRESMSRASAYQSSVKLCVVQIEADSYRNGTSETGYYAQNGCMQIAWRIIIM